jgi:hypothetical protein
VLSDICAKRHLHEVGLREKREKREREREREREKERWLYWQPILT